MSPRDRIRPSRSLMDVCRRSSDFTVPKTPPTERRISHCLISKNEWTGRPNQDNSGARNNHENNKNPQKTKPFSISPKSIKKFQDLKETSI